jgi:hypothetical protein
VNLELHEGMIEVCETLFELRDRLRDGRLTEAELGRRRREGAGVDHADEERTRPRSPSRSIRVWTSTLLRTTGS